MRLSIVVQGEDVQGFEDLDISSLSEEEADSYCEVILQEFKSLLYDPTKVWELSTRACNVLRKSELVTLKSLEEISINGILRLPNCGSSTLYEILNEARRQGWALSNWEEALRRSHSDEMYRKTTERKKDRSELSISDYDFGGEQND